MNLENKKILVAYFSHTGENYFNGEIVDIQIGNTAIVAKIIHELTGADLFEIQALQPYPFKYDDCTTIAKNEVNENARPQLLNDQDINDYEVIFLGYPNWWGTMPMPVWTFLDNHDFKNKIIFPFCTHEGSAMGKSEYDLKKICHNSLIADGLPIKGSEAKHAEASIQAWIRRV